MEVIIVTFFQLLMLNIHFCLMYTQTVQVSARFKTNYKGNNIIRILLSEKHHVGVRIDATYSLTILTSEVISIGSNRNALLI